MRAVFSLFLVVISIVFISGCCTNLAKPPKLTQPELASLVNSETVALVAEVRPDRIRPYCSGVWITDGVILTANHCVQAYANFLAYGADEDEDIDEHPDAPTTGVPIKYVVQADITDPGVNPSTTHNGFVIFADHTKDLAIISTYGSEKPAHYYAHLAANSPAVGTDIYITGHPRGLYYSFIKGVVAAYRIDLSHVGMDEFTGPWMQVSAPVWFGNSGGGVFDDDGNLLGIASFIPGDTPNTSCFVYLGTIREMLVAQRIISPTPPSADTNI